MIRKAVVALAAVALAAVASFALSPVAGAQYAPTCNVTVAPTSAAPGDTVTVSGSLTGTSPPGPVVGQEISFSIGDLPIGSAITGADGTFSAEITIPVDLAPGTYSIVADCGMGPDGEILGNTDIAVTGTTPPPTPPGNGGNNGGNQGGGNGGNQGGGTGGNQGGGNQGGGTGGNQGGGNQGGGNLARTGTDLGLPVQIGVALLALGGIALALSASRRRNGATA